MDQNVLACNADTDKGPGCGSLGEAFRGDNHREKMAGRS